MPYRRLPKTDQARIRSLQVAISLEQQFGVNDMPVPFRLINEAKTLIALFSNNVQLYNQSQEIFIEENKKHQNVTQNIRMYLSHFIQVYNMAIARKEFKQETRLHYKLPIDSSSMPDLSTEGALLEWGKNIIEGEANRIREGGVPMSNPTIAKVQVHYEIFRDFKTSQNIRQQTIVRNQNAVVGMRDRIDDLIKDIWDHIEDHYKYMPPYTRLKACSKCGIIYYYRNGERELTSDDDIDLFNLSQSE